MLRQPAVAQLVFEFIHIHCIRHVVFAQVQLYDTVVYCSILLLYFLRILDSADYYGFRLLCIVRKAELHQIKLYGKVLPIYLRDMLLAYFLLLLSACLCHH